ncbi:MAG: hypothetical protein H7X97_13040 [Opitutaceae bacterium]|nr:hypothetical protein [Verrucomicrobiales bacterium]
MKKNLMFSAALLLAGSLIAAESSPKDDVAMAAKKLGEKTNYGWKTTVVVPEGAGFRPGPTEGKTEKDGFIVVSSTFGDNKTETVLKGEKGAVTDQDGVWQSLADVEKEEGFGRFRAMMARAIKTPAVQAAELAANSKEIKKDGDFYASELTDDGAKAQLRFGPRGGGPEVKSAKGAVKFWLKDGLVSKYEMKLTGTMNFNGEDRDIDRTTTVEIKDVGTTKVTVPEEAKKKLS